MSLSMYFSEMKAKDVINRCDCKKLGRICDLILDERTGQICSIVVPGPLRFCGLFSPEQEYVIPWNKICKIGPDIILVEICTEECLMPRKRTSVFS